MDPRVREGDRKKVVILSKAGIYKKNVIPSKEGIQDSYSPPPVHGLAGVTEKRRRGNGGGGSARAIKGKGAEVTEGKNARVTGEERYSGGDDKEREVAIDNNYHLY